MNVETGEIKSLRDLTKEQKECGKWIQLNKTNVKLLQGMNRKERREYAKENGVFSKGKWGWR